MQRILTWVTLVSVAIVIAALYHVRKVHATVVQADHHGCSVASLKGTYAFRRTGVNNDVGGPIAEIGIAFYGGDGTRGPIRNTRSGNGKIRPWTDFPAPNGTYTVHRDCTGAFFDPNGTRANNLRTPCSDSRTAPSSFSAGLGLCLNSMLRNGGRQHA